MKFLLALTAALVFTSCKSPEPKAEAPEVAPETRLREIQIEQANLLNRKLTLEKQLERLVLASKIDPNGKMKRILADRQQAYFDLQKSRNNHPSLQKINEEIGEWKTRVQTARIRSNNTDLKVANDTLAELSSKLQNLSKDLPIIREAQDRIDRSEQEIKDLKRTLAATTPEGKVILDEIHEIEKSLATPQ